MQFCNLFKPKQAPILLGHPCPPILILFCSLWKQSFDPSPGEGSNDLFLPAVKKIALCKRRNLWTLAFLVCCQIRIFHNFELPWWVVGGKQVDYDSSCLQAFTIQVQLHAINTIGCNMHINVMQCYAQMYAICVIGFSKSENQLNMTQFYWNHFYSVLKKIHSIFRYNTVFAIRKINWAL